VAIHEVGEHDGLLYFSMDYIEGQNLAKSFATVHGRPRALRNVFATLLKPSITRMNMACSIVDLKPSNVLIDADGKPRLTDFWVSQTVNRLRRQNSKHGNYGIRPGPRLAKLHAARNRPPAGHRDLTPALRRLFSRRPSVSHADGPPRRSLQTMSRATLRLVSETEPVAPRLLTPALPRDLETICLKCLEKNPVRRYATAQDLAMNSRAICATNRFAQDQLAQSPDYRAGCQRHPPIAALWTLLVLVLIVGASAVFTQWRRAEQTEDLIEIVLAEIVFGVRKFESQRINSFSLEPVWPNSIGQRRGYGPTRWRTDL
jgi:serine/threonine-protein kinase